MFRPLERHLLRVLAKTYEGFVVRLSRMPSSFLWPLIISRDAYLCYAFSCYTYLRYAFSRYAFLRYAYLRYTFSRYAFLRYTFSRYASLRYAFLRYAFLRYAFSHFAFLRYAYLRYAFSRYAFLRYAFSCYAFCHSVCLSAFWQAAWYLKRVFALQLWFDAFPIWNIESACCYSALAWCMYNLDNLISIPGYWILS